MVEVKKVRNRYEGGHLYRLYAAGHTTGLAVFYEPPTDEEIEEVLTRKLESARNHLRYCKDKNREAQRKLAESYKYEALQEQHTNMLGRDFGAWKRKRDRGKQG